MEAVGGVTHAVPFHVFVVSTVSVSVSDADAPPPLQVSVALQVAEGDIVFEPETDPLTGVWGVKRHPLEVYVAVHELTLFAVQLRGAD